MSYQWGFDFGALYWATILLSCIVGLLALMFL